jgi:rhodanese-related sulfurtransferase
MPQGYLADIDPEETWKALGEEPDAVLVDVRTAAEWNYVGVPDVSALGVPFFRIEWQGFPSGEVNAAFVETLSEGMKAAGKPADAPVYFLCRSGARSASAARAMTAAGYSRCYNVAGGFEGARDDNGHRGTVEGWKAAGLPWVQP